MVYVIYDGLLWKLTNAPVGKTLLPDLRQSNPGFLCELESNKNSMLRRKVPIYKVTFQYEN